MAGRSVAWIWRREPRQTHSVAVKTLLNVLTVLNLLTVLTVLSSCNRGDRTVNFGQSPETTTTAAGTVWRGIYERDAGHYTFRACNAIPVWQVMTSDSLLGLLDATVDWHAARPSTRIFAQLRGDTLPPTSRADSVSTFRVIGVDSTRAPQGGECSPRRPEQPPPADPVKLNAAVRAALGADSVAVSAGSMRSASIWLNGDWRPDALVLVRGDRFCTTRGCTLLVLGGTADGGYELKSRVTEVQAPVVLRPENYLGWRELHVRWNGGAFGEKTAILRWNGRNYPTLASTQPQLRTAPNDSGTVIPR